MAANELLDLYASSVVANTEKQLACRLDSSITGVKSAEGATRRLVGLQAATGNTGYIIGRLDQVPLVTLDMALANGLDQVVELDIPIPVGQQLSFFALSTVGTAAVALVAHVQRGG